MIINDQIRTVVAHFNALFRYSPQGTNETTQEVPLGSSQFFPWFVSGSLRSQQMPDGLSFIASVRGFWTYEKAARGTRFRVAGSPGPMLRIKPSFPLFENTFILYDLDTFNDA